jgi:nitroimidazol reductase NimA-like FMN-containing flavoprotein (pyridoxamine 5'-phosphate oxidase superfamily)
MPGELNEIDRAECLRLLTSTGVGRLAVAMRDGTPVIRPITYAFDASSQSVVFRTASGSKLHGLLAARRAAFEIDGLDPESRTGWSVIILGVAEDVTSPAEVRRLEALGLEPWAGGDRPHWIRIRARTVSGRRIVQAGEPVRA